MYTVAQRVPVSGVPCPAAMDLAGGDGIIREPNYFDKEFTMQLQALMWTGEYSVFPIKRIATGGKGAVIVDLRARDDVGGKREQRDPCREELAKTEAGLWRELSGHSNVIGLQIGGLQKAMHRWLRPEA